MKQNEIKNMMIMKLFIKFLKDNNALNIYLNYLSECENATIPFKSVCNWDAYKNNDMAYAALVLVSGVPDWSKTKEGYNYWTNLNRKWVNYYTSWKHCDITKRNYF